MPVCLLYKHTAESGKFTFMFKYLLVLLIMPACTWLQAQTVNGSFVFDGLTRTYSFYVPASYNSNKPAPLVLNLHGYTSNGQQQAAYTNFAAIADTAGFIVVHPDGTIEPNSQQRFWNFGIAGTTVNDIGFLGALIDTISAHYTINPNRVYSTGMSNGGYMSYALACQTNRFAAIASVTGSMSVPMYNSCNPANPIPVMDIHGTTDSTVPYAGNTTSKGIADVVAFWANKNNCNPTPTIIQVPNTNTTDNTTAERQLFTGGTNGHTVEHYKVTNGGHTWPGGTINLPTNGNTCRDFSASKEIWRFFSQYEKGVSSGIEKEEVLHITLWPNPATNMLHLQADKLITRVSVLDIQGRVVLQQAADNIQHITLSGLQTGCYLVKLTGNGFESMQRVVVQ